MEVVQESTGVTTIVEEGTYNKAEGIVGERDGGDAETDADTIAVGVSEGDEDEEEIIDGDSLEKLSSMVLSWLDS
jgi:hypothetical protein